VSEDTDDAADAVAWARANVGTCRQPPDVDREPVQTELAEQKLGLDLRNPSPTVRASQPSLVCELYTYLDLADRADALADWLIQARRALIDPVVSSYGEQVIFPSGEEPGPPYGVAVVAQMKSVKGRWSRSGGDSTSWDRALKRLRAGSFTTSASTSSN
jgi:hypothetical protein